MVETKYQHIARIIKEKISNNIYPPGSKLPGHMTLAREFNVSVITSNRALKELEIMGLVERRERNGTFVLEHAKVLKNIYVIVDYQLSDASLQVMDYWRGAVSRAQAHAISIQMIQTLDPNFSKLVGLDRYMGQGLIFVGRIRDFLAHAAKKSGIPYVYIGLELDNDAYCVLEDRRKTTRELVKILIKDGYRRIGFIGHLASINHGIARDGYIDGIKILKLGYRYIRDAGNENIIDVTKDLLAEDLGVDAVIVMGAELPIAALPVILASSRKPVMGVLTENSHILQLGNAAYIGYYSQLETGKLAVELIKDIAAGKVTAPVTRYSPFKIFRPGEAVLK